MVRLELFDIKKEWCLRINLELVMFIFGIVLLLKKIIKFFRCWFCDKFNLGLENIVRKYYDFLIL